MSTIELHRKEVIKIEEKKDQRLNIRISSSEREKIKEAWKKNGVPGESMSSWIIRRLLEFAKNLKCW